VKERITELFGIELDKINAEGSINWRKDQLRFCDVMKGWRASQEGGEG
jgi:hypothetical protein